MSSYQVIHIACAAHVTIILAQAILQLADCTSEARRKHLPVIAMALTQSALVKAKHDEIISIHFHFLEGGLGVSLRRRNGEQDFLQRENEKPMLIYKNRFRFWSNLHRSIQMYQAEVWRVCMDGNHKQVASIRSE